MGAYHKGLLLFFFFFRHTDLDKYGSLYFRKPIRTEPVSELSSLSYSAKKTNKFSCKLNAILFNVLN